MYCFGIVLVTIFFSLSSYDTEENNNSKQHTQIFPQQIMWAKLLFYPKVSVRR